MKKIDEYKPKQYDKEKLVNKIIELTNYINDNFGESEREILMNDYSMEELKIYCNLFIHIKEAIINDYFDMEGYKETIEKFKEEII